MPEGSTPREIDDFVTAAMHARRGPLPPRRGCAVRSRRGPGGHPGPLCGLRRRRVRRRRRAGPPRLHRRRADDRPAHARRGAGVGLHAGCGHRSRRPRRRRWCAPCATALDAVATSRGATGVDRRHACCCSSGPTRPSRPGHWVPEMVTAAGGVPDASARPGEKSVRVTWEQALAGDPDVVVVRAVRLRPGRRRRAGRASWSPPGCCRRTAGLGGRRQRILRASRAPSGRRGRERWPRILPTPPLGDPPATASSALRLV